MKNIGKAQLECFMRNIFLISDIYRINECFVLLCLNYENSLVKYESMD